MRNIFASSPSFNFGETESWKVVFPKPCVEISAFQTATMDGKSWRQKIPTVPPGNGSARASAFFHLNTQQSSGGDKYINGGCHCKSFERPGGLHNRANFVLPVQVQLSLAGNWSHL
ncbi:hypothetical protein M514_18723 [Trichuris suis]|uniref:Uncharacterized protein n=1 Tax=Trichuris suis TaxID=68888 RepID=A0A085NI50_9BILA|nr:hypothetical protein M514_18723 [Trichuris suis]